MSEQQNERNTIKKREFVLELSNADAERICDKAAIAGLSPEKLLEVFIGDLVDGTYAHGSDERMYANQWYDRCSFTYLAEKNLVTYLAREGAEHGKPRTEVVWMNYGEVQMRLESFLMKLE